MFKCELSLCDNCSIWLGAFHMWKFLCVEVSECGSFWVRNFLCVEVSFCENFCVRKFLCAKVSVMEIFCVRKILWWKFSGCRSFCDGNVLCVEVSLCEIFCGQNFLVIFFYCDGFSVHSSHLRIFLIVSLICLCQRIDFSVSWPSLSLN